MKDNASLRHELLEAVSGSHKPFIQDRVRFGMWITLAFFGALIGWSFFAPLSTGAIATGQVIVEGETLLLQHLEGGIVGEINKVDGDTVQPGDVVMILKDVKAEADRKTAATQLLVLEARRLRLLAERDGVAAIDFTTFNDQQLDAETVQEIVDVENRYLASRNRIFGREDSVYSSQIESSTEILTNGRERLTRVEKQLGFISKEVDDTEGLLRKGHATQTRVLALKRQKEQYESESYLIRSQISDASVQLATARVARDKFRAERENMIDLELQDLDIQLAEARGMMAVAEDRLERMTIRASRAGTIMNSQVKKPGEVVSAGSTLAELVPENTRLIVTGKLNPADSSSIKSNLPARITIMAFNSRTAPTLDGRVIFVSPDVVTDEATGLSWYPVHVEINEASLSALGDNRLQPGLPAQIVIKTASRPVIGYLLDPIVQSVRGAFHED